MSDIELLDDISDSRQEDEHDVNVSAGQSSSAAKSLLGQVERLIEERQERYREPSFAFRRRGNEKQFDQNKCWESKLGHVDRLLTDIQDNSCEGNIRRVAKRARDDLGDVFEGMIRRNKLIKLADTSEGGWATVSEYETHQLAENSEDERRILKAESRAVKEIREAQKRRGAKRPQQERLPQPVSTGTSYGGRRGVCYGCGKPGHWRFECAATSNATVTRRTVDNSSHDVHPGQGSTSKMSMRSSFSVNAIESNGQIGCLKKIYSVLSPFGRLKCNYKYWHATNANSYVLDVVKNGYKLPLYDIPTSVVSKNNASSLANVSFVDNEISKLLKRDLIENVYFVPEVVNPLTVADGRSGKKRLVLDCRHINMYLHKFKYRYEDANTAMNMFNVGDVGFNFDLTSAYHHIQMFSRHRKYLGFYWKSKYYVFKVLPFGLSTAGYICTKVLRHPVQYWRSQGIRIIMYLDDGIAVADNNEHAVQYSKIIREDLEKIGFIVATDKSDWTPKGQIRWLGLNWNFDTGFIHLPSDRLSDIHTKIGVMLCNMHVVNARCLASVIGKIQSAKPAIGEFAWVRTKYCHMCLETRNDWDSMVVVTERARSELLFWRENLDRLNGRPFSESTVYDVQVHSDASGVGYGGFLTNISTAEATGQWSRLEYMQSSTWRELKAVHNVLFALIDKLKKQRVQWCVDNINGVHS